MIDLAKWKKVNENMFYHNVTVKVLGIFPCTFDTILTVNKTEIVENMKLQDPL